MFKPYKVDRVENYTLEEEHFRFASRETSIARDEAWQSWLVDQGAKSHINLPDGKIVDYYIETEGSHKVFHRLKEELLNNWKEHIGRYEKAKTALCDDTEVLVEAVETISSKEYIVQDYQKYLQTLYDYGFYVWSPWAVILLIEPALIKKLGESDIEVVLSLEKPIEYMKMERDLFELDSTEVTERYGWLNVYGPQDRPFTPDDFKEKKQRVSQSGVEEKFEDFKKTKQQFAKLLASLDDPEVKVMVEIVHEYAWLKTDRVDAWRQVMAKSRSFYEYLTGLDKELSLENAVNLFSSEIRGLLQGKKNYDLDEVQKRTQSKAAWIAEGGVWKCIYNESAIEALREALLGSSEQELRGVIASKGKVKGRVRIISHTDDLKKVKKGDVFVARYTFPTFTPQMIISAAIITDEGGITSHAAIVSRECGIPCIVGVNDATKRLKDGDMVEVDAEKGVVRKISN